MSKNPVSRLCEVIDGKVMAFLDRPIEGDWPSLWIDANYCKVRRGGHIVSVAVIIAMGVNADGRSEVLGMEIGTSKAEPIRAEFLRELTRSGPAGSPPARPVSIVSGCGGAAGFARLIGPRIVSAMRLARASATTFAGLRAHRR